MTTTPKQEAHTATPWHIGMREGYNASNIYAHDGEEAIRDTAICQVYGLPLNTCKEDAEKSKHPDTIRGLANAAFIVRACNSHDALVAALEEIAEMATKREPKWNTAACLVIQMKRTARRALELARTPTPGEKP